MNDPIDHAHFEAATFGDRALQREVLRLFDEQVEKLLPLIARSEGKPRMEAAHTLKGAARGIGAFALADAAERIERGEAHALADLSQHAEAVRNAAAHLIAKA